MDKEKKLFLISSSSKIIEKADFVATLMYNTILVAKSQSKYITEIIYRENGSSIFKRNSIVNIPSNQQIVEKLLNKNYITSYNDVKELMFVMVKFTDNITPFNDVDIPYFKIYESKTFNYRIFVNIPNDATLYMSINNYRNIPPYKILTSIKFPVQNTLFKVLEFSEI